MRSTLRPIREWWTLSGDVKVVFICTIASDVPSLRLLTVQGGQDADTVASTVRRHPPAPRPGNGAGTC